MKVKTSALCLIFLIASPLWSQKTDEELPSAETEIAFIHDFDSVFSIKQCKYLSKKITAFEKKTTCEIAVVTVSSIAPYDDIANYSMDLFNKWGVGKKDKNNGVMILLCRPVHKVRLTVGLGLESILNQQVTDDIVQNFMLPDFKQNNYYEGIKKGLVRVMEILQ